MLCSYCVMKELIVYESWHGVMWLRWWRSRQYLAWWTGCNGEGQVKALKRWTVRWWSLGKTWRRWTEATVKSGQGQDRWTKEVMWWYGVDHIIQGRSSQVLTHDDDQKAWWRLVLVWRQCLGRWNGKGMTCRAFHFTKKKVVQRSAWPNLWLMAVLSRGANLFAYRSFSATWAI